MKTEESITRTEKKFAMIESWKLSGQSQAQYCQEYQIALSNFSYWLKKYKVAHESVSPEGSFVEVRVKKAIAVPV